VLVHRLVAGAAYSRYKACMLRGGASSRRHWFAVRCIYRHGVAAVGTYEERITIWSAGDVDQAIAMAEDDAQLYADTEGVEYLGLAQAYIVGERPGHGDAVYSLMRDSALDSSTYLDTFFDTGDERQAVQSEYNPIR
jgi:hypothetical protein